MVSNADVSKCLAELSAHMSGSEIEAKFESMIAKANGKIEESYSQLKELCHIKETLLPDSHLGTSILKDVTVDLHSKEKDGLRAAIQYLDGEVRRTKDLLSRTKGQIQNELEAMNEEYQKVAAAVAELAEQQSRQGQR